MMERILAKQKMQAAVEQAIGIVGTKTSLKELAEESAKIYGTPVSEQYACIIRGFYRKRHGLDEDCRRYQTQTRRDMLNDDNVSISTLREFQQFFKESSIKPDEVLQFMKMAGQKCHSMPQMFGVLEVMVNL